MGSSPIIRSEGHRTGRYPGRCASGASNALASSEQIAPPGVAAGQHYPEQVMGALDG
ncbi:MAG: hypothetical protein WKF31_03865 [Thermoleophilaceae bacterium]